MLSYLNYLKARYLGQEGQGMVEYAAILAIVIAVGVALSGDSGILSKGIKDLYTSVIDKVATIK